MLEYIFLGEKCLPQYIIFALLSGVFAWIFFLEEQVKGWGPITSIFPASHFWAHWAYFFWGAHSPLGSDRVASPMLTGPVAWIIKALFLSDHSCFSRVRCKLKRGQSLMLWDFILRHAMCVCGIFSSDAINLNMSVTTCCSFLLTSNLGKVDLSKKNKWSWSTGGREPTNNWVSFAHMDSGYGVSWSLF